MREWDKPFSRAEQFEHQVQMLLGIRHWLTISPTYTRLRLGPYSPLRGMTARSRQGPITPKATNSLGRQPLLVCRHHIPARGGETKEGLGRCLGWSHWAKRATAWQRLTRNAAVRRRPWRDHGVGLLTRSAPLRQRARTRRVEGGLRLPSIVDEGIVEREARVACRRMGDRTAQQRLRHIDPAWRDLDRAAHLWSRRSSGSASIQENTQDAQKPQHGQPRGPFAGTGARAV
jgi:hypothetical protein